MWGRKIWRVRADSVSGHILGARARLRRALRRRTKVGGGEPYVRNTGPRPVGPSRGPSAQGLRGISRYLGDRASVPDHIRGVWARLHRGCQEWRGVGQKEAHLGGLAPESCGSDKAHGAYLAQGRNYAGRIGNVRKLAKTICTWRKWAQNQTTAIDGKSRRLSRRSRGAREVAGIGVQKHTRRMGIPAGETPGCG